MTASDRPCRTDLKPTGKVSAFKLVDLTSPFLLYGFGFSLSLLVFLLELIIGRVLSSKVPAKKANHHQPKIVTVNPAAK